MNDKNEMFYCTARHAMKIGLMPVGEPYDREWAYAQALYEDFLVSKYNDESVDIYTALASYLGSSRAVLVMSDLQGAYIA